MVACLDDLEAFAFVGGAMPAARVPEVIAHADTCVACHELIEELCAADKHDAPAADPLVGSEVAGYRIGSLLAVGGMGRVYRATELSLDRDVVVKVPRTQSPWLVRRFEREVAITARLSHPGIVPIHAAGRLDDGTPFYVMPLVDGVALDVALARASNRSERLALLPHLLAVANTMAYVHREGIAHRDLKPQNVLVGRFGETVILDWGLAKRVDEAAGSMRPAPILATRTRTTTGRTTRPGDVLGTPVFMSPEQARGEAVDQRSDVYAIGAILEQLLTGRLPRKAADAALAHAPPELVAICRRAMAAERDARHADGGELASELRIAMQHRPAIAARAPRNARWPLACATAIGVAVGLAIGWL